MFVMAGTRPRNAAGNVTFHDLFERANIRRIPNAYAMIGDVSAAEMACQSVAPA